MLLKSGEIVGGRYKVVRALGKGGMGEVYEVEHHKLGVHYALKIFVLTQGPAKLFRKRFVAEGRVLARLKHPNIAHVHDLGFDPITYMPYFVMDLVLWSNGNPKSMGDLSADEVRDGQPGKWFGQLCDALDYIHGKGVVHRDIKPGNVLIDENGNAVLADFGISRYVTPTIRRELEMTQKLWMTQKIEDPGISSNLTSQWVLGTDGFRAPEVVRGGSATAASDAYSLGLVFFWLLTGIPFDDHPGVFDLLDALGGGWRKVLPMLLNASEFARPQELQAVKNIIRSSVGMNVSAAQGKGWARLSLRLIKSAAEGDHNAQFRMGEFFASRPDSWSVDLACKWFLEAATAGNVWAQVKFDDLRVRSSGFQDEPKLSWCLEAATAGNAFAHIQLGERYVEGRGVEQNYYVACDHFQKAAETKNVYAQFKLGEMHVTGRGVKYVDMPLAISLIGAAAEFGIARAQLLYGRMCAKGRVKGKGRSHAIWYLNAAAKQGLADAQFELGCCYMYGAGVSSDCEKARMWLWRAAAQEYVPAQVVLALYETLRSHGGPSELMRLWLKRASRTGFADANLVLAQSYARTGRWKDRLCAWFWYWKGMRMIKKAAGCRKGCSLQARNQAQCRIGHMYRCGWGVRRDLSKAAKWYREAADAGDAYAKWELAKMHFTGLGVEKDAGKAYMLLLEAAIPGSVPYASSAFRAIKARTLWPKQEDRRMANARCRSNAERGEIHAQYHLGICYLDGLGVEKDIETAHQWFDKVISAGSPWAMATLASHFADETRVDHDALLARTLQSMVDTEDPEILDEIAFNQELEKYIAIINRNISGERGVEDEHCADGVAQVQKNAGSDSGQEAGSDRTKKDSGSLADGCMMGFGCLMLLLYLGLLVCSFFLRGCLTETPPFSSRSGDADSRGKGEEQRFQQRSQPVRTPKTKKLSSSTKHVSDQGRQLHLGAGETPRPKRHHFMGRGRLGRAA